MSHPTTGGSWSRDPVTGALTRIDGPAEAAAPAPETVPAVPEPEASAAPEEPVAAPEKPVTMKKGR